MRTKDEITDELTLNIAKAPKEARSMLVHEYCLVEVLIDIRDIHEGLLGFAATLYNDSKDQK